MDALSDYTGYLLRTAFLRASAIAARRFEAGTHPRDAGVLITLINSGPVSQQELVERLDVNRTLMVKLIDSLEQRGLVMRVRNPDDRRAYALHPTTLGREALAQMLPTMAEAEAELAEHLSAEEVERLKELLRPLIAAPADLGQRLGFLLSKAPHRFHERADRELEPLEIQIRHFGALSALAGGVPSQRELADRLSVSTPVVVEMVDALEAKGLVERRRDPNDRRSNALHVTQQGQETLRTATKRLSAANQELTARIGLDGDRELRSLLRKLLNLKGPGPVNPR
jgi:DNA-binding MarR family transcriptional regulator